MLPILLIVDDEPRIFQALRRTLHREELQLRQAASAEQALAMLEKEEEEVAIVLADENMPGMNGSRLLGLVRQRWPHTVRMLLTGSADLKVVVEAVNQGHIAHFFTKPCKEAELIVAIREALEQHSARRRAVGSETASEARASVSAIDRTTTTPDCLTVETPEETTTTRTGRSAGTAGSASREALAKARRPTSAARADLPGIINLEGLDLSASDDVDDVLHDLRRKLDDLAR